MSNILDEFRRDESRVLDRLVDAELSEDERRRLLAGLDDEPGAWRRCALAFLEAQSWRGELRAVVGRSHASSGGTAEGVEARLRPTSRRGERWQLLLAMAASLFVAFGVGIAARPWLAPGPTDDALLVDNGDGAGQNVAANDNATGGEQLFRLRFGDFPNSSVDVPAVAASAADARWLLNQKSALPEEVVRAWQRAGHKVERQRELLPVDLEDGRRLVVPVEQVEVNYARPVY